MLKLLLRLLKLSETKARDVIWKIYQDNARLNMDGVTQQPVRKKIFSSTVNGKLSYRKCDNKICIDDLESRFTQTDPLPIDDRITMKDFDKVQNDLEDFK